MVKNETGLTKTGRNSKKIVDEIFNIFVLPDYTAHRDYRRGVCNNHLNLVIASRHLYRLPAAESKSRTFTARLEGVSCREWCEDEGFTGTLRAPNLWQDIFRLPERYRTMCAECVRDFGLTSDQTQAFVKALSPFVDATDRFLPRFADLKLVLMFHHYEGSLRRYYQKYETKRERKVTKVVVKR